MKGFIALEDGTVFEGQSFGAAGSAVGEAVFNTSLTGYQEILTDPSYCSQVVTMTYPLIGNYGINEDVVESARVQVSGFVVKEACKTPSNFTSQSTIHSYLQKNNIVAIEGIDTRALTRHLRVAGAMKACIAAGDSIDTNTLIKQAQQWQGLVGVDIVKKVTCAKEYDWPKIDQPKLPRFKVIAYDFGIKYNIMRMLAVCGCEVTVVPASTTAEQVLAYKPDGVFLSNGPGDPAAVTYAVENLKKLLGKLPIFGICLGHQLLALALGGQTYKLKFGHRGANHPVKNLETNIIEITSQNHGFCVDINSLSNAKIEMTHLNLNDNTCEGLIAPEYKAFSVQYHPEASPGPHDSSYLFEKFIDLMKK